MAGTDKITQEVLTRESRFVLQSVGGAGGDGGWIPLDKVESQLRDGLALELDQYVAFLVKYSYLKQNRDTGKVSLSGDGRRVITGEYAPILASVVVHHFRPVLSGRTMPSSEAPVREAPPEPAAARAPAITPTQVSEPTVLDGGVGELMEEDPAVADTVIGHSDPVWTSAEDESDEFRDTLDGYAPTELGYELSSRVPVAAEGLETSGEWDTPAQVDADADTWIRQLPEDFPDREADDSHDLGAMVDLPPLAEGPPPVMDGLEPEGEDLFTTEEAPQVLATDPRYPPAMDEGLEDGRYLRLRELGGGAIGTVYLARQIALARDVAVKEFGEHMDGLAADRREQVLRCFLDVVETEARLNHPNLVKLLDANTLRGHPYVVSEYMPGGSLRQLLRGDSLMSPLFAFKVMFQSLHALRYVHDCGLLHAGLKPENILFDAGGNVHMSDLGMGEILLYDHPDLRQVLLPPTQVSYLSPEILEDPSKLAPVSDLFALGVVFYEMLTGVVPVPGAPVPSEIQPDLPDLADELYVRLTMPDPGERYLSADDALEDIYRTDALHWFMDPRDALFFLGSVASADPVDGSAPAPAPLSGIVAEEEPLSREQAPDLFETLAYGVSNARPPYEVEQASLTSSPTWDYPVVEGEEDDPVPEGS